ncbi:MAG TPA: DUF2141 domain-containing protein [Parvularculaceae bacterium]|nr:DUF2141 domain-containing protein [Parvularculaceae bacterium]
MLRVVRGLGAAAIAVAIGGAAPARETQAPDFAKYAEPGNVVLAIRANIGAAGGEVRLLGYDHAEDFLTRAALKYDAKVNADGIAIAELRGLHAGPYAFVAYYDANGDGKLNRDVLGRPKEPYGFSNNVRPKLRKPHFDEAKVDVAPGEVIVMTLEN